MKNPEISVVIAVRNEEKTIRQCIFSLLNQNFPKKNYEIIFADGMSEDETAEIIKQFSKNSKEVKITLFSNKARDSGSGRNLGIKNSRGKIIVQLSGHVIAAPNLLKVLVSKLKKAGQEVAGVGCIHRTPNDASFLGHVFGRVMSSYLGGLGTSHIQAEDDVFVESVSFTAYWKKILLEVGLNDPSFKIGQDAELNVRIRKAGYKLLFTPKTYVLYYKRSSYFTFAQQMFRYGFARAKIIRKHEDSLKWVYMVPALFVIGFWLLVIGSVFNEFVEFLFTLFMISYIGAISSSAIRNLQNEKAIIKFTLAMMPAYFVEHFAYGVGFLVGMVG